ncbi:MAG: ABC transporter permease [Chitinophagaceae bacterium]|nr:ABC transporter permease [Chitinophagaceae bacterium]
MFKKTGLIIKREYLTRVRKRSFLFTTILLPLILFGFILAIAYFSTQSFENQKVAINDSDNIFRSSFRDGDGIQYEFTDDVTADNFAEKGYSAFLILPSDFSSVNDSVSLISSKQISIITEERIKDQINDALRNKALLENKIDKQLLDSINNIKQEKLYKFSAVIRQGEKTEQSNAGLSYAIGFASGMLIYLTLIIYGTSVMRGVMEEKTNRIAEVIISSVRPYQLMAGKIIGIAAVGLTQLLIWIVFLLVLVGVAGFFLPSDALQAGSDLPMGMANAENASSAMELLEAKNLLLSANWPLIISTFVFYFLGGYLFYAALFAAVGSVVNEDAQEAQALVLPVTMPIILSFVIMAAVINNPDSPMAVWSSIIPLSSPIVMMARIPSGNVPFWQLGLSIALLIAGFIFTTYIAAKIYRTGILLYGKKVTLKEIGKWLFRKS